MRLRSIAVAFQMVLCMTASARAADVAAWRLLADSPAFPPALSVPVGVEDPVRHRVLVLETGLDYEASPVMEVHVFDPSPVPHWSELATQNAPLLRTVPAVVYDPVRDRLLMFGGDSYSVSQFEVWALSLEGQPTWTRIDQPGMQPSPRAGQSAVYDFDRDRVIVFGGTNFLPDVWAYSLATNRWAELQPGEGPGGREGHGAIYDPTGHRMVIVGGHDGSSYPDVYFNDVWALALDGDPAWTELHPEGPLPTPRSSFGAIFDPMRNRMLVHSGFDARGGIEPDDLWALDLGSTPTWSPVAAANAARGRAYSIDVYDPIADQLLSCGGSGYPEASELPLGVPEAWHALLPARPLATPGARTLHAVLHDSRRDRFAALGGTFSAADSGLWQFDPTSTSPWRPVDAPPAPDFSFFGDHVMQAVYDSTGDRFLFVRESVAYSMPADGSGSWSQLGPGVPNDPKILGFDDAAALDTRRNRFIASGGMVPYPHAGDYTVNGVVALPLGSPSEWSALGSLPEAIASHQTFYDPGQDRLVVIGGYARPGFRLRYHLGAVLWTAPLSTEPLVWTERLSNAGVLPPGPPDSRVAFDPKRERVYVFSDSLVWVRGVDDTTAWQELEFASPRPRVSSAVAYDPVRDQVIALFAQISGSDDVQAWALTCGPPSAILDESIVSPHAIALKWESPAGIGRSAALERSEGNSGWTQLGTLTFDDYGLATFTDAGVRPGFQYNYRVSIIIGGSAWFSPASTVVMPPQGALALAASPNPAVGVLQVAFNLQQTGPARLEAFDIQGRLRAARAVGELGPGTHTVALGDDGSLPPGLYLLRLKCGSETRTARVILTR